jgi:hypothetical protein
MKKFIFAAAFTAVLALSQNTAFAGVKGQAPATVVAQVKGQAPAAKAQAPAKGQAPKAQAAKAQSPAKGQAAAGSRLGLRDRLSGLRGRLRGQVVDCNCN